MASNAEQEWWRDVATIQSIHHYAHMAGLLYKTPDGDGVQNLSVTLQPAKFPEELYQLVWELQPDLNHLVDAVSRDVPFLKESLQSVIKVDDFTNRLFQLMVDSQAAIKQPKTVLGIHRADYLLDYKKGACPGVCQDRKPLGIKQVEINTMAVSLGGMVKGPIQDFHQYIHSRYVGSDIPLNIPAPAILSEGLAAAWQHYGQTSAYVLLVSMPMENNVYDQRILEYDLWKRYRVKVLKKKLEELSAEATLNNKQELFVCGHEIAVVYYRSAFTPDQHSEKDWSTRLLLECSRAAICPSVEYQLLGTKKMQQVLAAPGILERYIDDAEKVQRIRSIFTGLYTLDMGVEGDLAIEKALESPEDYVLKPQREGGGNNFFDMELKNVLEDVKSSEKRGEYILMDKIHPPTQSGLTMTASGTVSQVANMVCELGIYGLYLRQGDKVLLNKPGGSLARSKAATTNEGGVFVQASALDSADLLPTDQFLNCIS